KHYQEELADSLEWGCIIDDAAVSARIPLESRPGGSKLAGLVESGDVVIVTKMDRAFRNLEDLLRTVRVWGERGVSFHILNMLNRMVKTDTPLGRLLMQMAGAVAEYERAIAGERVREVMEMVRARGGVWGVAPYGFKSVGRRGARRLAPDPEQRQLGK